MKGSFLFIPKAVKPLTDWNEEEDRHRLGIVNNFIFVQSQMESIYESDKKWIHDHIHTT